MSHFNDMEINEKGQQVMKGDANIQCEAVQHSDQMSCEKCNLVWDINDSNPPACRKPKPYTPGERQAVAEYPTGINTCVHGTHVSLPCEKCSSHLTQNQMNVPGYENLGRILQGAYDQSAKGKGKHRHANNKPFEKQPIMAIGGMVGVGGHSYQICKKAQEATSMVAREEHDAAIAELRGGNSFD